MMSKILFRASNSWELAAIPLFILMGELIFRSDISERLFRGLAPLTRYLPGGLLHTNVFGSTLFASVCGSSAATTATVGKITTRELASRGYNRDLSLGSLAGAGSLGLLIPPSIIMIVYGVAANVSISKLFLAGVIPGLLLAALFMGYIVVWALFNKDKVPAPDARLSFVQKLYASRHLIPVVSLIVVVLGAIYSGIATATEAAALGVGGSLILAKIEGSLDWARFKDGLVAACRVYCMIGLILAGAVLSALPVIVLFLVFQRYFLEGVSYGVGKD